MKFKKRTLVVPWLSGFLIILNAFLGGVKSSSKVKVIRTVAKLNLGSSKKACRGWGLCQNNL